MFTWISTFRKDINLQSSVIVRDTEYYNCSMANEAAPGRPRPRLVHGFASHLTLVPGATAGRGAT